MHTLLLHRYNRIVGVPGVQRTFELDGPSFSNGIVGTLDGNIAAAPRWYTVDVTGNHIAVGPSSVRIEVNGRGFTGEVIPQEISISARVVGVLIVRQIAIFVEG